jgi:tape measure domain-containing protein
MTEIASLKIRVDALEAKTAADAMNKMAPAASKAQKAVGGVTSASSALNKVLGVTAGLLSAREILQAAESWTTLNNRLRLVTDSSEAFNSAQENIFRIAQETRQGLTATAELYQRIATNQKELGLTGKETADIVQTINQALVISGTSGAGAEAALVQLGQAFASGTLRGEELNAVLEQAPALAQAIAAGMGVTVGQLRALGAEGVLTADAVVQALQSQATAVEDQFATMAPTVSGALTQLDNSFIQLIGRMDDSTGASANASEAISKLAAVLSDPRTIEAANSLAAGLATAFTAIIEAARDVVTGVRWMAEEAAVAMGGIGLHDIDRLEAEAGRLQALMDKVRGEGYGPGTAIFENLLGSFEENEQRLNQAYDLMSVQTQAQDVQQKSATTTETVTQKVVALSTATNKLTEDQKASIKSANDLDRAHQSNGKVITDLAEQIYQAGLGASELAQRQSELSLNPYATPEQIASVRQLSAELQRLEDAKRADEKNKENTQLLGQVDPVFGEQQRFQKELEDLRVLNEAKLLEDVRYLDLKGQAERAHAEQMRLLQEENFRAQSMSNELLMASLDHLGQATTKVVTGLITGATNGEEAMRALAGAILNEAVGAVVQMGIQYVKSAIMGQSAAAAGAAASIALGASTSVALASMYAAPAALASLATMGANAAPAMAGITSTVGLSKAMALASFDGGGFTGTGSRSGGMDGKGGFMAMLHPNETVLDHTKGQGMGGGVTVNVIESRDKAGTQQTRTGADGKETVDVFVADIMGDGPRARAMQSAFGLSRQGR